MKYRLCLKSGNTILINTKNNNLVDIFMRGIDHNNDKYLYIQSSADENICVFKYDSIEGIYLEDTDFIE